MLKTTYGRYKLQHTSTVDLRRGSRSQVARNGSTKSPKKSDVLMIPQFIRQNGHDINSVSVTSRVQNFPNVIEFLINLILSLIYF